jgi:hypothetical protein
MTKGKGKIPGAGGLNKHIKHVAKKERAQPQNRKSLGPLEKHKDYKKRSAVRKARTKRVQQLKRAAALRNPDEFNVKMTQYEMDPSTGKMRKIEKIDTSDAAVKKAISSGRINAQFLERKAEADLQRAKELSALVGGLDARVSGKRNNQQQHTVFVDSAKEVKTFNAAKHFNTTKEMLKAPAVRGSLDVMSKIRVGHALDKVDDATLLRRFHRGGFDWDEELKEARQKMQNNNSSDKSNNNDDDQQQQQENQKKKPSLQDSRSLRESLLGKQKEDDSITPAVLLRMLRRAAILEQQHREEKNQVTVARRAKEIMERVARADRLTKLAKVVKKKTAGKVNQATEKERQKFRPGTAQRSR